MIDMRFDTEALTSVRFAISPMLELIRSITALSDPSRQALHLPWIEQSLPGIRGLDLSSLRALQSSDTYNPDFVNPPPSDPIAELADELELMARTPGPRIRSEVLAAYPPGQLPAVLEPFVARPRTAIRELARLMQSYWERSLASHWPRIKALLEQDVLYRARQFADGGTRLLFSDLDDTVRWDEGVLHVEGPCNADVTLELDERGLLLMPSVFVWPKVAVLTVPPWQPTLIYPARGVGMLWSPDRPAPPDALAKLIGAGRAAVLMELDCPRSTTELAQALGISPGGVSQHLAILRDAGLVSRRRASRLVLYLRSPEGDALVAASA
jgi:Bacterial regulatory protein, arsR family/Family of unknown function (DUF5937)